MTQRLLLTMVLVSGYQSVIRSWRISERGPSGRLPIIYAMIHCLSLDETTSIDVTVVLTFAFPENETEISFFNRELYEQFKRNPEVGPSVALPYLVTHR